MNVEVHLLHQSSPVIIEDVKNTYQKGDLFCVMGGDNEVVYKFPLVHIFRIKEYEPQSLKSLVERIEKLIHDS